MKKVLTIFDSSHVSAREDYSSLRGLRNRQQGMKK